MSLAVLAEAATADVEAILADKAAQAVADAAVARAGRVLLGMDAPDVRHAARMRGGSTQQRGGAGAQRGGRWAAQGSTRRAQCVGPASGAGRTPGSAAGKLLFGHTRPVVVRQGDAAVRWRAAA
eukprot:CAMPEP_0185487974 /NCGR_PEP_ID=MMETSP1366-20130426/12029_1 /TAXON_ID=38817 /ORGANISM="Gephyrocapsa oceanica, Strain RCC1303" /LENGTH=123 /DNA_ID=CAMNT_0028096375 /DNA_START=238 /DNA_END=604 /DNA_ORIENTATION=-